MEKRYQYKEDEHAGMVCEPAPAYSGAALAEPNVMDEVYPLGLGSSLDEVRQTLIEAKEHEDDPDFWLSWEDIDNEFRNRYPGWK